MRSTVECGLVGTCATYLARYTRGFHWHPSVLECNWWGVHGRKWTSYGWQLGLVWSQAQLYRFIPEDRFWLIKIKFTAVHRRHGRNVHLALLSDSYDTHRLTFGLDRIQYNSWSEVGECRPLLRPLSSWVLLVMEAFVWIFFYHWNGYFTQFLPNRPHYNSLQPIGGVGIWIRRSTEWVRYAGLFGSPAKKWSSVAPYLRTQGTSDCRRCLLHFHNLLCYHGGAHLLMSSYYLLGSHVFKPLCHHLWKQTLMRKNPH